jgi:hypothetical protein
MLLFVFGTGSSGEMVSGSIFTPPHFLSIHPPLFCTSPNPDLPPFSAGGEPRRVME